MFLYTHDGTAINVAHIVTIFLCPTRQDDGYVVRCSTVLQTTVLTLSPTLPSREAAEEWLHNVVISAEDFPDA